MAVLLELPLPAVPAVAPAPLVDPALALGLLEVDPVVPEAEDEPEPMRALVSMN